MLMDRRIVAIDRRGKVVALWNGTVTSSRTDIGNDTQMFRQMIDIPTSQFKNIREFRLEARPYQWAEFNYIPLETPYGPRAANPISAHDSVIVASNGRAKLPTGATIELLDISDPSVKGRRWRADGSPLEVPEMPPWLHLEEPETPIFGAWQVRDLHVRCTYTSPDPGGAVTGRWEFSRGVMVGNGSPSFMPEPVHTGGTAPPYLRKTLPPRSEDTQTIFLERPQRQITARFIIGTGPFRTLLRCALPGPKTLILPSGETVTSEATKPGRNRNQLRSEDAMCITMRAPSVDEYRVLVIDAAGKRCYPPEAHSYELTKGVKSSMRETYYFFKGMTEAEIREMVIETRPYQWVEFRDIPLEPRRPNARPSGG